MWSRSPARARRPLSQIAKDFGISESCLHRWLKLADIEDGVRPGRDRSESAELRELRKRNRLLEQENEILRRAAAYLRPGDRPKMRYPLVLDLAADGIPVAVTCRVLGFSKQAFYQWQPSPVSAAGLGRRAPDQRRRRHPPRRPGVRVPVHRRRAARPRHHRRREPGRAAVLAAADLVGASRKKRGLNRKARPAGARRPGRRGTSPPPAPNRAVADRHHRAPHRRGQALPVRDQGRVLQPDRRLLHRRADDRQPGRRRAAQRDRAAPPGRHRGPLRPGQPVPVRTRSSARCTATA